MEASDYNSLFPPLSSSSSSKTNPTTDSVWNKPASNLGTPQYHSTNKISFSLLQNKKKLTKPINPFTSTQSTSVPPKPPPSKPPPGFLPVENTEKEYPEELTKYIERSFSMAKNEEERQLIDLAITKIITQAIKRNKIWTCNWSIRPLPFQNKNEHTNLIKRKAVSIDELEEELSEEQKNKRMKRFKDLNDNPPTFLQMQPKAKKTKYQRKKEILQFNTIQQPNTTIIGTCVNLEKSFYRQVSDPDPSLIRPEWVLRKSLKMLKRKWKRKEVDYVYICDQFKSIRQDMTMQGIKNNFTIDVYETHARLALENNDLNEFNQCQTKLKSLYDNNNNKITKGHPYEFIAYRILYLLHTAIKQNNFGPLLFTIQELTKEQLQNDFIKHSLKVKESYITRNYYLFLKLYNQCPNMGYYIMDKYIDIIRYQALKTITKSYLPHVSTQIMNSLLGFKNEKECILFLRNNGAVIITLKSELGYYIDTRKTKL